MPIPLSSWRLSTCFVNNYVAKEMDRDVLRNTCDIFKLLCLGIDIENNHTV